MSNKLITILIPCLNEEENVTIAYRAITQVLQNIRGYAFEFLFVDNGSTDKTRAEIMKLQKKDSRINGIFFSRNFGPEASIQAGFDHARGEAAILCSCDLQEPVDLIPRYIKKWQEGYDTVLGVYTKLVDPIWMRFFRKAFYRMMKSISDINIPTNSSGYGLYSRRVLDSMKQLPEKNRFARGIQAWVGFRTAYIPYERRSRIHGKSSYTFFSYIKHSERSVFGFSYLPLDLLIYFGLFLVFLSFLFIVGYVIFFFMYGNPIKGAVTTLVAIVFFGGVNLLGLSIIGKYIQVVVEETKQRPTYIIDSVTGKNMKNI